MTLWLIIVVESTWMLGCAIFRRYGHVRATTARVRSTLDTAISQTALTNFELKSRAHARRRSR